MRNTVITLSVAALAAMTARPSQAHCQVPCGIYDDAARVAQIREDITTIEKSVKSILEMTELKDAQSINQTVRWVNTKEAHASHIIEVVSEYFLAQKIKVATGDDHDSHHAYHMMLTDHHAVMVAAMKTKQTVSLDAVAALKEAVDRMAGHWTAPDATQSRPAATQSRPAAHKH